MCRTRAPVVLLVVALLALALTACAAFAGEKIVKMSYPAVQVTCQAVAAQTAATMIAEPMKKANLEPASTVPGATITNDGISYDNALVALPLKQTLVDEPLMAATRDGPYLNAATSINSDTGIRKLADTMAQTLPTTGGGLDHYGLVANSNMYRGAGSALC